MLFVPQCSDGSLLEEAEQTVQLMASKHLITYASDNQRHTELHTLYS